MHPPLQLRVVHVTRLRLGLHHREEEVQMANGKPLARIVVFTTASHNFQIFYFANRYLLLVVLIMMCVSFPLDPFYRILTTS